jgi:hypothetical protein
MSAIGCEPSGATTLNSTGTAPTVPPAALLDTDAEKAAVKVCSLPF